MIKVFLVQLSSYPIYKQLQLEEALLRSDERNWCLINDGTADAIVMGISGQPSQWLDLAALKKREIPLIRRFTGGGTVYVDTHTLFITWICQADLLQTPCCPEKIMSWTEKFYAPLFEGFRVHENDYVWGDRKFGGNAQYLRKNRWLHHSSFLWDFDPQNMELLTVPPRMPRYRAERSHTDFLGKLKQSWPDKEILTRQIRAHIQSQFQVVEVDLAEALLITERPHRKATSLIAY